MKYFIEMSKSFNWRLIEGTPEASGDVLIVGAPSGERVAYQTDPGQVAGLWNEVWMPLIGRLVEQAKGLGPNPPTIRTRGMFTSSILIYQSEINMTRERMAELTYERRLGIFGLKPPKKKK